MAAIIAPLTVWVPYFLQPETEIEFAGSDGAFSEDAAGSEWYDGTEWSMTIPEGEVEVLDSTDNSDNYRYTSDGWKPEGRVD